MDHHVLDDLALLFLAEQVVEVPSVEQLRDVLQDVVLQDLRVVDEKHSLLLLDPDHSQQLLDVLHHILSLNGEHVVAECQVGCYSAQRVPP